MGSDLLNTNFLSVYLFHRFQHEKNKYTCTLDLQNVYMK